MKDIVIAKWRRFIQALPDWAKASLSALVQIFVVYVISNLIFIVSSFKDSSLSFSEEFQNVLLSETNSGQILTLVCALIAPVLHWVLVERKKHVTKSIFLVSLILILLFSCILQYSPSVLSDIKAIWIYCAAVSIWFASVFAEKFPPEAKGYARVLDEDANNFAELTKGVG